MTLISISASNKATYFENLPAEVRNKIYSCLFSLLDAQVDQWDPHKPYRHLFMGNRDPPLPDPYQKYAFPTAIPGRAR